MTPFRILILSDGRAGHFNLSEGIAAAVERLGRAETRRVEVRRGGWPGAVLAALTRSRLPADRMLAGVYGVEAHDLPQCDLIVSAGAETLAANVWLARTRGKPNIFYGSLRLFRPDDFALVLTSYARQATSPKHALALKPSRLDPDSLGTPPEPPGKGLPQTLGFLIGGDAGPIQFHQEDWDAILALIRETGRRGGVRWLVANSRRTPDRFSDTLAGEASLPGSPIASFLDVRSSGPGTLPQILGPSAAVLCTADSSSMLSEAIWARRPVIEIEPHRCPLTADEAEYRLWLRRSKWCGTLAIRSATPASLASALGSIRPTSTNPQDALAQLIRQRLSLELG